MDLLAVLQMAVQGDKDKASLSSADLHCLCVTWEMFTSHRIQKIETGRSVLLPWAELQRPLWM